MEATLLVLRELPPPAAGPDILAGLDGAGAGSAADGREAAVVEDIWVSERVSAWSWRRPVIQALIPVRARCNGSTLRMAQHSRRFSTVCRKE
jgi:hypothetical protein